ncbi:MAG TPA: fatty acid desaturase, partial [Solirubrobacterales bacterium]|nr:fatty acid desaturase [Solirubrobacterales bacterium]
PFFHVMSGNLGYQVEHHLFPDMPSSRYAQIAPRVKDICERYELPYNTGPFFQQWGMVNRTIVRLAFPGGEARPKPGPYKGGDEFPSPSSNGASRNGSSNGSTNGKVREKEPASKGSSDAGPEQEDDGVRVDPPERNE